MAYSEDTMNKISEYASLLTPISDIAVLLDIDEDELRHELLDRHSPTSKAYYRAKAEIAMKLRKQEIELAVVGSPLAVQLTSSYLVSMDSNEDL